MWHHVIPTDDILLQEDLIELMPMVLEANAISEELNKKMFFEIALVSPQARGLKDGRTEVSLVTYSGTFTTLWINILIREVSVWCV